MRLALADSGDSVEDANFVVSVADAGILRLFTFVEWVKEMLREDEAQLRGSEENTFHDKVFDAEMNQLMRQTETNFEKMLFREGLRTGFFEMQGVRDKYRELCGSAGMSKRLVRKFIEWQAVALSPVCPHVSDYIWRKLLGNSQSVFQAGWPQIPVAQSDEATFIKSSEYLMEAARDFRLKLKSSSQPAKAKKGQGAPTPAAKPTHATLYVAKTYPPWQSAVLSTLKSMYEACSEGAPDNKQISVELGKNADLKKFMKKVMPFVAFTKERIGAVGMSALDLTLDFDELRVLEDNIDYLINTLALEGVDVKYSSEAAEKVQEECRPGNPFIVFRTEPSVSVKLVNNQPHTGLFGVPNFPVMEGDTVASLAKRLHRMERNVKDHERVSIFRYSDPVMGPRKIPSLTAPLEGKTEVSKSKDKFRIDLASNKVSVELPDGKVTDIGEVLVYRI